MSHFQTDRLVVLEYNGHGNELLCPNCRGNNLHQERIEVFRAREGADRALRTQCDFGKTTVDSDMRNNPSARQRDGMLIHFDCEHCKVGPSLAFYQHKGSTFLNWLAIDRCDRSVDDTPMERSEDI
jgi:hypothetical protein